METEVTQTPETIPAPPPGAERPADSQEPVNGDGAPEGATVPPDATKTEPEPFSPQFARMARREKQLRDLERQVKEREQKLAEWEENEKLWDEDPLAYLNKRGRSYDELTRRVLEGDQSEIAKKVAGIEKQLEAERKSKEEAYAQAQELARQQAEVESRASILEVIESNPDLEILRNEKDDAVDFVYGLMKYHYERTAALGEPRILDFDEACKLAEDILDSQTRKRMGLSKFTKSESKDSEPQTRLPGQPANDRPNGSTDGPRTLTNGHAAASAKAEKRPETDDENKARALAQLRWNED